MNRRTQPRQQTIMTPRTCTKVTSQNMHRITRRMTTYSTQPRPCLQDKGQHPHPNTTSKQQRLEPLGAGTQCLKAVNPCPIKQLAMLDKNHTQRTDYTQVLARRYHIGCTMILSSRIMSFPGDRHINNLGTT